MHKSEDIDESNTIKQSLDLHKIILQLKIKDSIWFNIKWHDTLWIGIYIWKGSLVPQFQQDPVLSYQ